MRRRREREARHKQAGTERRRTQMMENMGLKASVFWNEAMYAC